MELHYNIEKKNAFILVACTKGTVISEEWVMMALDHLNDSYEMHRHNAMWDFRGCTPIETFSYKEINSIVNYIETSTTIHWSPKVAILVDGDLQYGLSRMFQIMTSDKPSCIEVFKEEDEALQWLKNDH